MKIKEGFILRKVGVQYIVAATGAVSKEFNGMMRLNENSAFAFRLLQEGTTQESLAEQLVARYGITPERAAAEVDQFIRVLEEAGALA